MNRDGPLRVLVFDSGIGGLSVATCIHEQLPRASIVYLADNAAFPYGDKPETVVIDRCCTLIAKALKQYPCDVIVVACNTASTVALPHVRALADVPVVGVVPAVKPAAQQTRNRRIGILATPATVRRVYLDELVEEFAAHCEVWRVGHPGLVQWAEALARGVPVPQDRLDTALESLKTAGVDTMVLGCTHYPLLLENLRQSLPAVQYWVDSGAAIARRVVWLMGRAGKLEGANADTSTRPQPVTTALFSGPAPDAIAGFMAGLGLQPGRVTEHWCAPS
ncbi:glutamate racemase [Marinobacter piscensis]|uniref:glutamate racemase n=1 Tax=Marinobacter piscensis TaxID=1562308 RepID=UPI0011A76031|nr:glutamate racemase [Marinobacter piscensis]